MVLQPNVVEQSPNPTLLRHLPKLSTTLLEVVGPLLDTLSPAKVADRIELLLDVGWLVWNVGAPGAEELGHIGAEWEEVTGKATPRWRATLTELLRRRRELFGHDPRCAEEPTVVTEGGALRIQVATLDTPALRAWLADSDRPDLRAGLAPSFAEFVRDKGLDHRFVRLGLPPTAAAREGWEAGKAHLEWRSEEADWNVPPLSTLVRGDARPPDANAMSRYPARYLPLFMALETTVLAVAAGEGRPPLDAEVAEAYSDLRRGRAGRGPSFLRDALRQRAALELALRPYSAAEFEAVMRQLERSVRRHHTDPVSRGYAEYLDDMFEEAGVETYE